MYSTLTTDIGISLTSTVLSGKAVADYPIITAVSAAAAAAVVLLVVVVVLLLETTQDDQV